MHEPLNPVWEPVCVWVFINLDRIISTPRVPVGKGLLRPRRPLRLRQGLLLDVPKEGQGHSRDPLLVRSLLMSQPQTMV